MIIGKFRYETDADTYTGELRTLTVQRKGVVLRPLRKASEREPDYRVVEVTDAGTIELGVAQAHRARPGLPVRAARRTEDDLPRLIGSDGRGVGRRSGGCGLVPQKWRALFLKEAGSDGRPESDLYP